MKILQLCNKPPQPKIDGGCIAMSNLSEGLLKAGHELDILTVATDKHPFNKTDFSDLILNNCQLEAVHIDTRINVVDAFSSLLSSDSYNVSRFFSSDFDFKLIRWLSDKSYDIVQLESVFMTPYIPSIRRLSKAKIVLRSHNLEHVIWERLANTASRSPKKLYLKHLASRLKKYEIDIINKVDAIASISHLDTKKFSDFNCQSPIKTIPFGIDLENFTPRFNSDLAKLKLFHIGAMDWSPNIEAVDYILDEIFPKLNPEKVELNLAGKSMSESLLKMDLNGVNIHGEVPSVQSFMNENHVMIVPLLSGSGMRVKIIEAMAMGKVVITTTVGAEGIEIEDGKHLFIANSPKAFIQIIKNLIGNKNLLQKVGKNARILVEEKYDNQKIIQDLIAFYQEGISSSSK